MSRVLAGLGRGPGAVRLVAGRLAVLLALSGVGFLVVRGAATGECGYGACGVEPGTLDLGGVGALLGDAGGTINGALAGSTALFWLFDQVWTATALRLFDPRRQHPEGVHVFREAVQALKTHLLAFVRIAVLCLPLMGLWAWLVGKGFGWLDTRAALAGAVGSWRAGLGLARLCVVLLGLSAIATWGFWCRVLTATDRRRRVRRTVVLATRACWRRPLTGFALAWVTAWIATALSGPVAVGSVPWAWSATVWLPWLLILAALQVLWVTRLHVAAQVYADPALCDLHRSSDAPWGIRAALMGLGRALWRRVRR